LASFLQTIIADSLSFNNRIVKNSYELYRTLSGKKIGDTNILVSLDVILLFTNVPQDLAMESILNRWTLIEKKTNIPKDEFIGAIELILSSTYFTFNKKIYRQTFGTPMGSPLSPIIANIVLQDLEKKTLERIDYNILFYFRYVDDILLSAPSEHISEILDTFNSFHKRLQFTVEYEVNRKLSFLDLMLEVDDGMIIVNWFQKETFSGRVLSYYSNHPKCHKMGTIYNLTDRAILLAHPKYYQKNIELCIKILRENGYPLAMIFETINKRLKKLFTTKSTSDKKNEMVPDLNGETDPEGKKQHFYVIPYMRNISEITASLIRKSGFTVGFRSLNKIEKIVRVQKDQTEYTKKSNTVYKISCKDCDATYTGQTKRQLQTNNIKLDSTKHSVISEHILKYNHMFDWNNVKILDIESNYNRRLVSEMLHIREQKRGINSQKDTEFLNESYFCLLDNLSNQK